MAGVQVWSQLMVSFPAFGLRVIHAPNQSSRLQERAATPQSLEVRRLGFLGGIQPTTGGRGLKKTGRWGESKKLAEYRCFLSEAAFIILLGRGPIFLPRRIGNGTHCSYLGFL